MNIEQLAERALERPPNWADLSDEHFMYVTHARTYSTSRDADVLATSNWEVISGDMEERFPDDVRLVESSHWAVGWVIEMFVRVYKNDNKEEGFTEAFEAAFEWYEKLERYPVADEDDFAEREREDFAETLQQSYDVPEDKVSDVQHRLYESYDVRGTNDARDVDIAEAMSDCDVPVPEWLAKAAAEAKAREAEGPKYRPGVAAVQMSTIDDQGRTVAGPRTINANACPHIILTAEHYREDGTCRCNDPEHKEMVTWGYRWKEDHWG